MARPLRYPDFDSLPRICSVLYAFQASNGLIKVGRTMFPFTRMTVHRKTIERAGLRIERHAIATSGGALYDLALCDVERELITRLGRLASVRPGTNEWFEGVSWGAAKTLLGQIAHRQIVTLNY